MKVEILGIHSNKHIATQSNKLTEARYGLSVREQKVVLLLISMISPDDKELKDYEMKVTDFAQMMGLKSHNIYEQLNETLDKLLSRVLHIPTENGFLKIGWVSSAEYIEGEGTIFLSFDKKLKPYLLQLKEQFTKYKLFIITQFKSAYTVRIYMLLKQYERMGFREFDLMEFRSILGISEKEYAKFYDFRKRVLNQAKREFESKNKDNGCYNSDISFDLETIRTGRKITRLRFNIKKQVYQEPLLLEIEQPPIQEKPPAVLSLEKHGINEEQARKFIEDKGEEYILRCVSLFEEASKSGKVKNKGAGYLIKLIQAGAGNQTKAEKQAIEAEKKKAEAKREAKIQKKTEKEVTRLDAQYCKMARKDFLASLSEEEKENLLKALQEENPKSIGIITTLEAGYGGSLILNKIPNFYESKEAYIQKNL